jgi:hypothetical protein
MGLMDRVKRAVEGRSGTIEKGIDRAVSQVNRRTRGRYAGTLEKGARTLKDQARKLDDRRAGPGDGFPAP